MGQLGWVHSSHFLSVRDPEDPRIEYLLWTGASLPHFYILKCNFSSAIETIDVDGSLPLCPCVQVPQRRTSRATWVFGIKPQGRSSPLHTLSPRKHSTTHSSTPTHITLYMP